MPSVKRHSTSYPGVFYISSVFPGARKEERIYYVRYKRGGKTIEEKAGRQFLDDMTPSRAAALRARRMQGDEPSNKEKRAQRRADKDKWTIGRLWEFYREQKGGIKSLPMDKSRWDLYLKEPFANKEPSELVPLDFDRVRVKLLKTKTPQTTKHVLSLLRRIVNFGVKKGLCEGLMFKPEMPQVDNLKTEDLMPEQLERLLKVLDETPDIQTANLMRMALFTGMRRGELLRLQWDDIDFQRGFIRIRTPKGGKEATIPLNKAARDLLETHPRTDSFVFPGRSGGQRVNVSKAVNAIKETAGLPKDFRPMHGLRHVYASMLASSGQVDLYTLQKLLTHKESKMTQRYAHLRDEALRRASELAGELLTGQGRGGVDGKS